MLNLPKYYTVQTPIAGGWQQCGNSRYMPKEQAESVYSDCAEHIAVAMFEINPATGEFEETEIRRNF